MSFAVENSEQKSNIENLPSDYHFLITLNQFPKFGPARLKKLVAFFENYEDAFQAGFEDCKRAGLEEKIIGEYFQFKKENDKDKIIEEHIKEGISVVTINCNDYPVLLKEIHNPPPLLYYRGSIKKINQASIAVVGSRSFSQYGKQAAASIVKDLSGSGISIVSGLAAGIDSVAHYETIENGGLTFAVLGTGVDKRGIYPAMNKYLADNIIASGGAILSEYPVGTAPQKFNFPQRNRVIAGLSLGTLVVEAALKSGALITAKCSLEQNREVFAVPGNIFSTVSAGPNELLKQGAIPVTSASDILSALNIEEREREKKTKETLGDTPDEKLLLTHISHEPIHIDELSRKTEMSASRAGGILSAMEIKGYVTNAGAMRYILKNY